MGPGVHCQHCKANQTKTCIPTFEPTHQKLTELLLPWWETQNSPGAHVETILKHFILKAALWEVLAHTL